MPSTIGVIMVHIRCEPEAVFATLRRLGDYSAWLPGSRTYDGTRDISDDPLVLGSTYRDRTPLGSMYGRVTELDANRRISFLQATGNDWLSIAITYDLTADGGATSVTRTGVITTRGPLALIHPIVVRSTFAENRRTLDALRAHLERAD